MAENVADSFVVEIGVKSEELISGLEKAIEAVNAFADKFAGIAKVLDKFGEAIGEVGEKAKEHLGNAQDTVDKFGKKTNQTGSVVVRANEQMSRSFGKLEKSIQPVKKLLIATFGIGAMQRIARTGAEWDKFYKRSGLEVNQADAWARANEMAGGSREAFMSAMQSWKQSGRRIEDFLRLGDMLEGRDPAYKAQTLRIFGISPEAGAAFIEFGKNAKSIAETMKGIAITPQQAALQRSFVQEFQRLMMYVEAIGREVFAVISPVAINLMGRISAFLKVFLDDAENTRKIIAVIAMYFGTKWVWGIAKAVAGLLGLKRLLKGIFLLSTGRHVGMTLAAMFPRISAVVRGISKVFRLFKNAGMILGKAFSGIWKIFGKVGAGLFKGGLIFFAKWIPLIAKIVARFFPVIGIFLTAFAVLKDIFDFLSGKESVIGKIIDYAKDKFLELKEYIVNLFKDMPIFGKLFEENEAVSKAIDMGFQGIGEDVSRSNPFDVLTNKNSQQLVTTNNNRTDNSKETTINVENTFNVDGATDPVAFSRKTMGIVGKTNEWQRMLSAGIIGSY